MRVMSLRNPTGKMSKSDPTDAARINLTDDADAVAHKIRLALTDSIETVSYDPARRPGVSNLVDIYVACGEADAAYMPTALEESEAAEAECVRALQQLCEREFAGCSMAAFKQAVTERVVARLAPIRSEYLRLLRDPPHLERVIARGSETASAVAQRHLGAIKAAVGLLG